MNNVLVAGFSHPIISDNDLASETSHVPIATVHSNRLGSEIAGTLIDLMVNEVLNEVNSKDALQLHPA
jgi:hypothetical protein